MPICPIVRRYFPLLLLVAVAVNSRVLACQDPSVQQETPTRPANPAFATVEDRDGLPRVLLLGDSISIGYTLEVRELLADKANVHRPATNCASTRHGLRGIDEWLGDKPWDVIHFNFGLHDLKHVLPGSEDIADVATEGVAHQVPIDEYRQNLTKIVERLQKTGATLIWRSTTPVPEGATGRYPVDAERYNAVAHEIMQEHNIPIDDLYQFARERLDKIQQPRNVHFTDQGSQALAEQVAAAIEARLPKTE